eukprot:4568348-Amphidinium_carterae.1
MVHLLQWLATKTRKIQFPCNHGEKVRFKGCEEPAACLLVCPYRLRFWWASWAFGWFVEAMAFRTPLAKATGLVSQKMHAA